MSKSPIIIALAVLGAAAYATRDGAYVSESDGCAACGALRETTRVLSVPTGSRGTTPAYDTWVRRLAPAHAEHSWMHMSTSTHGWAGSSIGCARPPVPDSLAYLHARIGEDAALAAAIVHCIDDFERGGAITAATHGEIGALLVAHPQAP